MLAAAYAFGLVKNHPYRDGNKRIGFLAMVTFLGLNGHALVASDALEVVTEFVALAEGVVSEDTLAEWIRRALCGKHTVTLSLREGTRELLLGH